MSILVVFSGLPGTGKSTLAQALGRVTQSLWLRIDDIEAALTKSHMKTDDVADGGYAAAQAMTISALRQGFDVVADCVNPIELTRQAWRQAGQGHDLVQVQVICSDHRIHRKRVEARRKVCPDCPDWSMVERRAFEVWTDADVTVDTAFTDVDVNVARIAHVFHNRQNQSNRGRT